MKKIEHTITVNEGDLLTILVREASGQIKGRSFTAESLIQPEKKAKGKYQHKSHETYLAKVISKYCYVIQTGKWPNGHPADAKQSEKKLYELLAAQSGYTLENLSDAARKSILKAGEASKNPTFAMNMDIIATCGEYKRG